MADRPRNDDWWLASDGRWYPPELHPGRADDDAPEPSESPTTGGSTRVSTRLTYAVTIALMLTSSLFIVTAFYGFRVAGELRDGGSPLSTVIEGATSAEIAFSGWFALAVIAFLAAGVLTIAWTVNASRAFDARGASGRRWRGGWTVGSWLIPLANFVLPKLLFNELERISRTPSNGEPVAERWRSRPRSTLGDLWWGLWLGGIVTNQASTVLSGGLGVIDGTGDLTDDQLATGLSLSALAFLLIAGAGIALLFVIRRIAVDAALSESVSLPGDLT